MDLNLPEIDEEELRSQLPNVSIVTITKDRGAFAGIMLYNWVHIKYPREKLEWLILDDTPKGAEYDLADYIPQEDPYINYVRIDQVLSVPDKRNKAVELAKYDYIVHMDDDDYYFPDHVLVKMRIMLAYKCAGVHSVPIGVYDMMEKSSYIMNWGGNNVDTNNIAEASIAYKKSYWEHHKFYTDDARGRGEGRAFIGKNFHKWVNVHFFFNMISITHSSNVTRNNRRMINESSQASTGKFEEVFPAEFMMAIENVRKILAPAYTQPDVPRVWRAEDQD